MASKRSPTNRDAEPPRIDNLKLINGIGPAVEKRLNGVGIFTFAKLAALSPADIAAAVADLTGLSAERIIKQDWIGQARKLAAKPTSSDAQQNFEAVAESSLPVEHAQAATPLEEPQQSTAPSPVGYHLATFTVELQLDENNNVQSTHIMHIESKREHTWSDLPKTELLYFLDQSAGVNVSTVEPVLANPEETEQVPALVTESVPPTSEAAKPTLAGTLHLRDMRIIGADSASPRRILPRDQPFYVHLTLDLTEMTVPANTSLNYKASIYGKSMGSRSGQIVGETEGTIQLADKVTINVNGNPLPEGIFQLTAKVMLAPPHTKPIVRPGTTAVIDGGLVQVY